MKAKRQHFVIEESLLEIEKTLNQVSDLRGIRSPCESGPESGTAALSLTLGSELLSGRDLRNLELGRHFQDQGSWDSIVVKPVSALGIPAA